MVLRRPIPNLRHLRAFREVARARNISQASERVHLSQPAITQAIAKLEDTLQAPLFERRKEGMFTTEPGAIVLVRVERALGFLERGARDALRLGQRKGGRGFERFDQLLTSAQLRALIAVSKAENFSLAARQVGISQPSLHRAARDLERLSGITLFEKVSQGIHLTPSADALVQYVNLALAELDQGFVEIEELKGTDAARIVVGTLPLARTFVLPRAINTLANNRPDVQISVIDGPYDDLLHGLRHGEIDLLIGALRDPVPIDDVVQEPLFSDQLAVTARAGHPLAAKKRLTAKQLSGYPWVVPRHGTPTREHFERMFPAADDAINLIETSSLILVRGLLLESDRLAVISAHQIRHERQEGLLVTLPVDMRGSNRPIGLTLRRDWQPTRSQQLFLDAIRAAGDEVKASM
jgi:LysR family transcriptional regulator of gallate degradation